MEVKRVQFTNDLLPSDIIGTTVFSQKEEQFKFVQGPIFTQLFFADELNRATPKTQSACLQAMEEGVISVEGDEQELPKPLYCHSYSKPSRKRRDLPSTESQLDRFSMKLEIGFPNPEHERQLLLGEVKPAQQYRNPQFLLYPRY